MCDKLKNWKFGVSMEMPSVDGTTNNDVAINTQRMPDFAASAQFNWNSSSHIKLGAIVRNMTYSSNVHDKAYSKTGFGLQALQRLISQRNCRHTDNSIMVKGSVLI